MNVMPLCLISPAQKKWISVPWLHTENIINCVHNILIDLEPNRKKFVSKLITKLKNKIIFHLINEKTKTPLIHSIPIK